MADFKPNTLYYGDNLGVLRDFPTECVDLVYLDPPFNSNRNYNVLFSETGHQFIAHAVWSTTRSVTLERFE